MIHRKIDMKRIYTVYMHTCNANGKMYIGISTNIKRRWRKGEYRDSPRLYNGIQKYGWDNFKHEVLLCNLTKQEAELFEVEIIKYYKSSDRKYGYNIQNGGSSSVKFTQETINKISENHHNKRGVVCLETNIEYKSIASAARDMDLSRFCIQSCCAGCIQATSGYHFVYSENFINNDIPEYKNKHFKSVICLETNIIYNTIKEAGSKTNTFSQAIGKCCMGKYKTAGGYQWEYYNENKR